MFATWITGRWLAQRNKGARAGVAAPPPAEPQRCVLLDVATNDMVWGNWSARALTEVAEHATLIINPIICAEVSIGYTAIEALDTVLPAALYPREPRPWEAGFLAGKSFLL